MTTRISALLLPLTLAISLLAAANGKAESDTNPIHDELRQMRDEMIQAWEAKDIDHLLSYLAENAIVTWQNGEVCSGREEVRAFYERMISSDDPVVADVKSQLEVDDLSIIYGGDTAVAYGTMKDHWVLTEGIEMDLESRWTATLVHTSGEWKLASYHTSVNLFDNPLLNAATQAARSGVVLATPLGLALGLGIGFLVWRKK